MLSLFKSEKLFKVFLWLIAFHSFFVGILLIILPPNIMELFGFHVQERFFQVQGGVFHIVMSVCYYMITLNIAKGKHLTILTFTAKFIATLFLISYFLFANHVITIFLSGLGDFLMAIVTLLFYINIYKRSSE